MATVEGMDRLLRNFRKVDMKIPNITSRFLDVIGEEALEMLRMNTPVDTGNLRDSWQLQKSAHEIVVANDQQDLLSFHLFGSISIGSLKHLATGSLGIPASLLP